MEPNELLSQVATLAKLGKTQKQIAEELGFKTTPTLNARLIKSSQITGKPVPAFRQIGGRGATKRIEMVEIRKRGNGESFGVNVPQEPLTRAGYDEGSKLSVTASKGKIVLRGQ